MSKTGLWEPTPANKATARREAEAALERIEREEREEQRRRTRLYNVDGRIMPITEREP